jgi:hypothetical protein
VETLAGDRLGLASAGATGLADVAFAACSPVPSAGLLCVVLLQEKPKAFLQEGCEPEAVLPTWHDDIVQQCENSIGFAVRGELHSRHADQSVKPTTVGSVADPFGYMNDIELPIDGVATKFTEPWIRPMAEPSLASRLLSMLTFMASIVKEHWAGRCEHDL